MHMHQVKWLSFSERCMCFSQATKIYSFFSNFIEKQFFSFKCQIIVYWLWATGRWQKTRRKIGTKIKMYKMESPRKNFWAGLCSDFKLLFSLKAGSFEEVLMEVEKWRKLMNLLKTRWPAHFELFCSIMFSFKVSKTRWLTSTHLTPLTPRQKWKPSISPGNLHQ